MLSAIRTVGAAILLTSLAFAQASDEDIRPSDPPEPYFSWGGGFSMILTSEATTNPGDPVADVGPNHHLAAANGRIRSFSKLGLAGSINSTTDAFFQSVRAGAATRDAQVAYDRLSQRWFVAMRTDAIPTRILLAVSNSPDLDASTSWTYHSFVQDTVAPAGNIGHEMRNLSMAVDRFSVILGGDFFNSGVYVDSGFFHLRKDLLVQSATLSATAFRSLADQRHPVGVRSDDPSSTTTQVVALSQSSGAMWTIDLLQPNSSPFIGSSTLISIEGATPPPVPVLGSPGGLSTTPTQFLSGVESRFNQAAGERRTCFAYHIGVNDNGIPSSFPTRAAIRYYEFATLGSSWVLRRGGVFVDPTFAGRSYFQPGMASTGQGHLLLGFNFGRAAERLGLGYGAVFASSPFDPFAFFPMFVSSNDYAPLASGPQPWGLRSLLRVDPANDQVVWAFLHTTESSNRWSLRAFELYPPGPPEITGGTPASLGVGTHTIQISGSTVDLKRRFFQTDSSFPVRASAGLTMGSPTEVRPGTSLAVSGPQNASFTVEIDLGTTPGTYQAFWQNPDGQRVQGGSINVTVPPPTITSSPTSLTARTGPVAVRFLGTNYYSGSIVQRQADNGTWEDRPTVFVNSGTVDATLSSADLFYSGVRAYRVRNGGNVSAPFLVATNFFSGESGFRAIRVLEGRGLRVGNTAFGTSYDGQSLVVEVSRESGRATLEFDCEFPDIDPATFLQFFSIVRVEPGNTSPTMSVSIYRFPAKKWAECSITTSSQAQGFFAMSGKRLTRNEPGVYVGLENGQPTVRFRVQYSLGAGRAKASGQRIVIDLAVLVRLY